MIPSRVHFEIDDGRKLHVSPEGASGARQPYPEIRPAGLVYNQLDMETADTAAPAASKRAPRAFCFAVALSLGLSSAGLPAAREESSGKQIESIRVETGVAGKVGVFFQLTEPFVPNCFSLVGENRKLVCDFIGAGIAKGIPQTIEVESPLLFRVRVGRHAVPEFKTRVVLDMDRMLNFDVRQLFVEGKNEYVLIVQPLEKGPGP